MALRIIDNKRIELTDSEFSMYQELVKAYTTTTMNGEEYFKDLFETDKKGIIVFIRPPSKTYSSMECFMFVVVVMVHQYLRNACEESFAIVNDAKKMSAEALQNTEEAKKMLAEAQVAMKDLKNFQSSFRNK